MDPYISISLRPSGNIDTPGPLSVMYTPLKLSKYFININNIFFLLQCFLNNGPITWETFAQHGELNLAQPWPNSFIPTMSQCWPSS
jgi:hypothetical protein